MKLAILICISVFIYLSAAEPQPRDAKCDPEKIGECTREYNPVCGDDGITYSTECMLCMENSRRNQNIKIMHDGECEKSKPMTGEADVPFQ